MKTIKSCESEFIRRTKMETSARSLSAIRSLSIWKEFSSTLSSAAIAGRLDFNGGKGRTQTKNRSSEIRGKIETWSFQRGGPCRVDNTK